MAVTLRSLTPIAAGLVGGVVFLVVELLFLPLEKHVPADWILRLMAGLLAGPITLTRPAGQIGALLVLTLIAHGTLSVLFGLFFCRVEDDLSWLGAIVVSAVLGFALYLVNFYILTLAFPWFATARGAVSIVAHVLFGVTTALAHKGLRRAVRPAATGEALGPAPST